MTVILYDGLCGFCDSSVQWILKRDRQGVFKFAALQSEMGMDVLARHPELQGLDTLVLVEGLGAEQERVSVHSRGIFAICARLGAPWRWGAWFGVLPLWLTDWGYKSFARNRYLVWGRREACRLPTKAERERFVG